METARLQCNFCERREWWIILHRAKATPQKSAIRVCCSALPGPWRNVAANRRQALVHTNVKRKGRGRSRERTDTVVHSRKPVGSASLVLRRDFSVHRPLPKLIDPACSPNRSRTETITLTLKLPSYKLLVDRHRFVPRPSCSTLFFYRAFSLITADPRSSVLSRFDEDGTTPFDVQLGRAPGSEPSRSTAGRGSSGTQPLVNGEPHFGDGLRCEQCLGKNVGYGAGSPKTC